MLRRLVAAGIIGWLAALALGQDEGFRFFLDTSGVGEQAPRPANSPLALTNPTVGQGTGVGRLYLYVEFGTANQPFTGVNLRVSILGDATFKGGLFYQHAIGGVARWQGVTGALAPAPGTKDWVINSAFRVGAAGFGLQNHPPDVVQQQDTHFRADDGSPFGTTLLGYFDVIHGTSDNTAAGIGIMSGDSGSVGPTITPQDIVYFGFGDAGTTNKRDRTSTDPDGYIAPVPEPATMFMGLAAILKWTVRRARCAR